jgi:hypothetical protein
MLSLSFFTAHAQNKTSSTSASSPDFPAPQTTLHHKLTLSGSSTAITIDANIIVSKACKDNLGVANFMLTGSNNTTMFWYNQAGTSYIWTTQLENQLKALAIPLSRNYAIYDEAGGMYNGLDMLANMCNRNNIPQNKIIVGLEEIQADTVTDVLAPSVYIDAVNYCKTKGYGFKYWEISNEPQYGWGSGLEYPTTYAQHVKDVYDDIKSVDSTALVGCQICRKSWYSDQVLKNIAGKADFIAGHWYGGLNNMDNYSISEIILADNFKYLDYIAYENQNIITRTGKVIPQIDTEWRLLAKATVDGTVYDGERNPRVGNIIGTMYQAVRLIYNIRDNYTYGSCTWHSMGAYPGSLVPTGYNQQSIKLEGKTTYLYWLYYYMIHNTGENVVSFSGSAPSFTGNAIHNVDENSTGNLSYTGPLTPLLVTKNADETKVYITIVNGSATDTVPFSATINNFSFTNVQAIRICDNDSNQNWYQNDNSRFVSNPSVLINGKEIACSLPPLSCTFITLDAGSVTAKLISTNRNWDSEIFTKYPKAEIAIYDINGKLVSKFQGIDLNWNRFIKSHSPTGIYLYVIDLHDGSLPLKGKMVIPFKNIQ